MFFTNIIIFIINNVYQVINYSSRYIKQTVVFIGSNVIE